MSGRLPLGVGVFTTSAAIVVLVAWSVGLSDAPRLFAGWRVMVPSSAFAFLCAGLGVMLVSTLRPTDRSTRIAVRALAGAMLVLPVATLLEYASGTRWGVERWLGAPIPAAEGHPYAGRMSAMTSLAFVLLAVALGALTWSGQWAFRVVRVAGGAALAVSWFAVLAISFSSAHRQVIGE